MSDPYWISVLPTRGRRKRSPRPQRRASLLWRQPCCNVIVSSRWRMMLTAARRHRFFWSSYILQLVVAEEDSYPMPCVSVDAHAVTAVSPQEKSHDGGLTLLRPASLRQNENLKSDDVEHYEASPDISERLDTKNHQDIAKCSRE